jgi:hypothetical protein
LRGARFQASRQAERGERFARLILSRHIPSIVETALQHMVHLEDDDGGPPLRRFRVLTPGYTAYNIFYRVFDDDPEVEVLAVLSGREDVDSLLLDRIGAKRGRRPRKAPARR